MDRKALVIGATGLVGSLVVQELLQNTAYSEVTTLVRTPLDIRHPRLNQVVVNWDRLESAAHHFIGVHDLFCCLGTTMKRRKIG